MAKEKHIFDLSQCPHPLSNEFVLMDDDLLYECDKYEEYTERATTVPSGQKIDSNIRCEYLTDKGESCNGTVQLQRLDVPNKIQWECQKCGEHGAVINFEDTYWDLSHLSPEEKEQYLNQDLDDLFDFEEFDNDMGADKILAAELDSMFQDMDDEELQTAFNLFFQRFDPQFVEEKIGLSAEAFTQLFSGNWKEPGAPMYIRDDISFKEAHPSLIFHNARAFLQLLAEQGSFKTTQAGNLKRKTVDELMKACRWRDGYIEKIHEYNKDINEQDVWLLHIIRILLIFSGIDPEKTRSLPDR